MTGTLGVPAAGTMVWVGLTRAEVVGGWRREGRTVLEVLMPSGRTMLYEPGDVFDAEACTGSPSCPAPVHVHGCFRDRGGAPCTAPVDHRMSA